jgi:pyruvate,water dikinase
LRKILHGLGISSGIASGTSVHSIPQYATSEVEPYILISEKLKPEIVRSLHRVRGIVCEEGSVLCHGAIIVRELGVPVVVGIANVFSEIEEGVKISIDGSTGEVRASDK